MDLFMSTTFAHCHRWAKGTVLMPSKTFAPFVPIATPCSTVENHHTQLKKQL